MILHEDKKKFHSAIHMAAAALNIKPHFVEKDIPSVNAVEDSIATLLSLIIPNS